MSGNGSKSSGLVGILGGMGPMAGVKMQELIVKRTKASRDFHHIPVLTYTNPQIPPRIGDFGVECVPEIVRSIKALERAGATEYVIACNTAHVFTAEIEADVSIPMISLIAETAKDTAKNCGAAPVVGLLGTLSLLKNGLYQDYIMKDCPQANCIMPADKDQTRLDELIQGPGGIKAGNTGTENRAAVAAIAQALVDRGATVIITACTEIPLVFNADICSDFPVSIVDPMVVVVDNIIARHSSAYSA